MLSAVEYRHRPGAHARLFRFRFIALASVSACLLCFVPAAGAQAHRDPLSAQEEEQVREATDYPSDRAKVYADFLAARVSNMQALGKTPEARGHVRKIHDLLEDYASIADEMAGNFDEYEGYETNHRFPVPDMRKQLKKMEPQFAQWKAVLKDLPPNDGYDFARTTAMDAHESLVDSYKELVTHQTAWFLAKHDTDEKKVHPVANPEVR